MLTHRAATAIARDLRRASFLLETAETPAGSDRREAERLAASALARLIAADSSVPHLTETEGPL